MERYTLSKDKDCIVCALRLLRKMDELDQRRRSAEEQMEDDWNYPERCLEAYNE